MGRRPRILRDDVLRAAREVFAEKGYHGATLAAIGARLQVSPAALLRHAPTKEALFTESMAQELGDEPLPTDFLAEIDPSADPRKVLRRLAKEFVPFLERKMGESIARWMRAKTSEEARTIRLPFDPRSRFSPPARVLAAVEDYFRKARSRGVIRAGDHRATALVFIGSLHFYVFAHAVLRAPDPPIAFDDYLDALFHVWTEGAIRPRGRRKRP